MPSLIAKISKMALSAENRRNPYLSPYNEETIYDNDFTAEYQAGLCKTYIDDLIAEKGKENIT